SKPKPKSVLPGEHLDLFPARLPRDCEPPLMGTDVQGLQPPMYILGWDYTLQEFEERFGESDEPTIIFKERIKRPFYEKY
ncbi:hypothetical protein EV715DRAFT_171292, partial [Schizophyllum commune]